MNELIIIEEPTPVSAFTDSQPIAYKLTEERAMQIAEESKDWPLPWEDSWKRMYVQGNVVPKRVTKRKGGKKRVTSHAPRGSRVSTRISTRR